MDISYQFVQCDWYRNVQFLENSEHEGPPKPNVNCMKTYNWDHMNSCELATDLPKCKIVIDCLKNVLV